MSFKQIALLTLCLEPVALAADKAPPAVKLDPVAGRPEGQGAVAAKQIRKHITLNGVNAMQVNWWFNHIADNSGVYFTPLSSANISIKWDVSLQQAHGLIGSLFTSKQMVNGTPLTLRMQYQDWSTRPRTDGILPSLPVPSDYIPPYPSPTNYGPALPVPLKPGDINGFNHDLLILNEPGYVIGRVLVSFLNIGDDDTGAKKGNRGVDMYVTYYLPWMAAGNRPSSMSKDGYYYTDSQIDGIWASFQVSLQALPAKLPAWWDADSQDAVARQKGYTTVSVVENGLLPDLQAKYITWFFNHFGDAPGTNYVKWAPSAHKSHSWVPGCSPQDIYGPDLPEDKVVVGAVSREIQWLNTVQDYKGVEFLDNSLSPAPGYYKHMLNASPFRMCGVKNQPPPSLLQIIHSWEDVQGGAVWRTTLYFKIPLVSPVRQADFQFEHSWYEGASAKDNLRDLYKEHHQGKL